MSLLLLIGIMATAHAEQTTLAAWDFTTSVKYTQTSNDGVKTFYTASAAEKVNMEYTIYQKGIYTIQSVNEYGSLGGKTSFEVTDNMATGIQSTYLRRQTKGNEAFGLNGCLAARGAQGIMIINGKKTISKHTNE